MLSMQSSLPYLPIPSLESTLYGYLSSASALVPQDKDLVNTSHCASEFYSEGGQRIQKKLLEHKSQQDQQGGDRSWLIRWWNELSYLKVRASLPINSSYYYLLWNHANVKADPLEDKQDMFSRVAVMSLRLMDIRDQIYTNTLSVDRVGKRPLCMYSYTALFHSCREPRQETDAVMQYLEADSEEDAHAYCRMRDEWARRRGYSTGKSRVYLDSLSSKWMIELETSGMYDDHMPPILEMQEAYTKVRSPSHIIVFVQGMPVRVNLWSISREGRHTPIISYDDLRDTFQWIYKAFSGNHTESHWFTRSVPWLTATDRTTWAEAYNVLHQRYDTATVLKQIKSAAFVVCLDDVASQVQSDGTISHECVQHLLLHGATPENKSPVHNRWWDKTIQLVGMNASGISWPTSNKGTLRTQAAPLGVICEHSLIDGHVTGQMLNRIVGGKVDRDLVRGRSHIPQHLCTRMPLFSLPLHTIGHVSFDVKKSLDVTWKHQDAKCLLYTRYGKEEIKKCGFSPDAWCQMAIQLATSRAYSRLKYGFSSDSRSIPSRMLQVLPTYEPVQMRMFRRGRTETVRSASVPMLKFVRRIQEFCSVTGQHSKQQEVKKSLKTAAAEHTRLCKLALQGQGIDRHLLGLFLTSKQEAPNKLPSLFQDTQWAERLGGKWKVSTSNMSGRFVASWGWGQVVPEGWGVAYSTETDFGGQHLHFTITGRNDTDAEGELSNSTVNRASILCEELEKALDDIFHSCVNESPSPRL